MELRSSAAHVFVPPRALDAESIPLDPADAHHLRRVLRLRPGEVVSVSDGEGRWRHAEWGKGDEVRPTGEVQTAEATPPEITIGFTPVKGDRPEWTVQKLTELGADRIIPLLTARSVVRWEGERGRAQVGRLRRVAREAAMQSRRCRLPVVEDLSDVALVPGALADPGGRPATLDDPMVMIGPEGGWSPAEIEGRRLVSLSPLVLRAETAALAAAVLLGALRAHTLGSGDHGPWS